MTPCRYPGPVALAELKCELSWSASRAKEFERCRREYWYSRYASWGWWKESAPGERWKVAVHNRLTSLPAFAGDCVHRAVARWFERRRSGTTMSAEETFEEAVALFREGWRQSVAWNPSDRPKRGPTHLIEHHYAEPLPKERTDAVRALLAASVRNFLESPRIAPARDAHPDHWRALEELDSYKFLGTKIYAVPDFAHMEGDILHIWDWKTGQPRESDQFQLLTYGLYACERWSQDPEAIVIHAAYLATGEVRTQPVTLEALSRAQDLVSESLRAMMELHYDPDADPLVAEHWTAAPEAAKCGTCRFRGICESAVMA